MMLNVFHMKQSDMPDQLTHEKENVPPLSPKLTKKNKTKPKIDRRKLLS